jgi:hypothetical protein
VFHNSIERLVLNWEESCNTPSDQVFLSRITQFKLDKIAWVIIFNVKRVFDSKILEAGVLTWL